ncbi:MAG: efflux RND transporter periplasmic adaptor subunit [Bacteroidales bacterium]|nr:efflux RND transporter periplasmic adaptor subunit [Bacteroidales bacterium]
MKLKEILILSALVALTSSCGSEETQTQSVVDERVEQVKITPVSTRTVTREFETSTTLQAYERMNISPSVTGNIEHIYVEVGDVVKKGDTLVRMDQNQLITTRIAFANLQVELKRMESLLETEAISQQAYDQIKLSFDQTKQSLKFLEENTIVKAKFDGVISAKNYEDGELYSGQPILELVQISTLKALINIPESFFPQVRKGLKVNLTSDIYPGEVFPATIEIVYPTIDPMSHTFSVKLRIPNKNNLLRPGMYASSIMNMGDDEAVMIPYQSVLRLIGSNERYVFLNDNNVAKRVFVTLGDRNDEFVEIIGDDLQVGDELITIGQAKLVDGSKINIVE